MSEVSRWPSPNRTAGLAHAGELAQWVMLLMAWVWLGEQGMRLGWSLASGVLAVVLWWAARLLCRGSAWALRAKPAAMVWCGGLSVMAVWLPEGLAPWEGTHLGLLVLAVLWGVWSGLTETRSTTSTFRLGRLAWHPVLAAAMVLWVWRGHAGAVAASTAVGVLLALCAAVLYARDRAGTREQPACRGPRVHWSSVLAPSAMGLMMGGLWLGNAWCAGWGGTAEDMVVWHLAMMACLPALVALISPLAWLGRSQARTPWGHRPSAGAALERPLFRHDVSWVLLSLGALMLLGPSALHGWLAMLLPSLAWAVHCSRPRLNGPVAVSASPWVARGVALVLGPGLLLAVGMASPMHGPLAMQSALMLLGSLAALQGLAMWVRPPVANPSWSAS